MSGSKAINAVGVVTNAPATANSRGFGFVTLDDGTSIYCSKAVVDNARMVYADCGAKASVRYSKISGRFVASRVDVLREPGSADQDIADALVEINECMDVIDRHISHIENVLLSRGCIFPEEE